MLSPEEITSHLGYLSFVLSKINLFYIPLSGIININIPSSFLCTYSSKLIHTAVAQNKQNTMYFQRNID